MSYGLPHALFGLLGEKAVILQRARNEGGNDGSDWDVAVQSLDKSWPLRMSKEWRLIQGLHYDVGSWYWVLEREGRPLAIDATDDPRGRGRYRFATDEELFKANGMAEAGARAAYLALKRARKGLSNCDAEWLEIAKLAQSNESRFEDGLRRALGARIGARLASEIVGKSLSERTLARARALLRRPRFLTNVLNLPAEIRRVMGRLARPTGLTLVIVGPDGTGKTTLAAALERQLRSFFRQSLQLHWRPGVLPRPGSILGWESRPSSNPHAVSPHGRLLSGVLLLYYWLDFQFGYWLRMWPRRVRSGAIIVERGWWDLEVDPLRYRLQVPRRLVRILGTLLPSPDLMLALEAPVDSVLARKAELDRPELSRQLEDWRAVGLRRGALFIDAIDPSFTLARAKQASLRFLERRAIARLGHGWVALPSAAEPRWLIPRGPASTAREGLKLYQPMTKKGRLGWEAARLASTLGLLRISPSSSPTREVREKLAKYIPAGGTASLMRVRASRWVALIIDGDGRAVSSAKVSTDDAGARILDGEGHATEQVASLLPPPLSVPRVIDNAPGVLVMEAVRWVPRRSPWILEEGVAGAMGALFAAGDSNDGRGLAHGDFAPWNLLRTKSGWVLLDWEEFTSEGQPLFDLFHYVVQGHALLGNPQGPALIEGLRGRGWVGAAIGSYLRAAAIEDLDVMNSFEDYLHQSVGALTSQNRDHAEGVRARRRLMAAIHKR